jgi:hypothetical protein
VDDLKCMGMNVENPKELVLSYTSHYAKLLACISRGYIIFVFVRISCSCRVQCYLHIVLQCKQKITYTACIMLHSCLGTFQEKRKFLKQIKMSLCRGSNENG